MFYMPKWFGVLVLLTSLAHANAFAREETASRIIEYFVVEVIDSKTIYQPTAEYRYHVRPLGNLSQITNLPFPAKFSTYVVLRKDTVGPGYWMLVKLDRETNEVNVLDVTTPQVGFSDSSYFRQIFYERLKNSLDPVRETLIDSHKYANVKVTLGVADDLSIQAKYNKPGNNLVLVSTDYYIDMLIPDFSPFFARYSELFFDVTLNRNAVVVRNSRHSVGRYFFYQAIDQTEPLPTSFRRALAGMEVPDK